MDEIKAEYDQLDQVANRFLQQSEAITNMLQRVRSSMEKLEQDGWKGRGAQAFFDEMHGEVLPACQRLHTVLSDGSQVSKEIIQIMRQAEGEAAAPFKASS
jgi:WXG100 family type VII secretion target